MIGLDLLGAEREPSDAVKGSFFGGVAVGAAIVGTLVAVAHFLLEVHRGRRR